MVVNLKATAARNIYWKFLFLMLLWKKKTFHFGLLKTLKEGIEKTSQNSFKCTIFFLSSLETSIYSINYLISEIFEANTKNHSSWRWTIWGKN